jgi:UDP-N-acetylmuramyl tripeptide synthase
VNFGRARFALAVRAGQAAAGLSRALGRGSGSVISGRVIETIAPDAFDRVLADRRIAVVSGTNGKSTTTALLATALGTRGEVVTNAKGANMPAGIVAALAGEPRGVTAALEVDEGYVPRVLAAVPVAAVILLNLSRDQLDRVSEVRKTAARWRDALQSTPALVVANADDPSVVFAARAADRVAWVAAGSNWRVDAASCPCCGARIDYRDDDWACEDCDLARPPVAWWLEADGTIHGPVGGGWRIALGMPGRHNQHNALMALVAASELGCDIAQSVAAMAALDSVEGRYIRPWPGPSAARLFLAKNPAGWIETLTLLEGSSRDVVVVINAEIADGKDTSWLWDVPFERLQSKRVVATGRRAHDLAVRLLYADVVHDTVPDLASALNVGRARDCDVVANYTGFRDVRRELAR